MRDGPFYLDVKVDGIATESRRSLPDPIARTVVEITLGWADRLRVLCGHKLVVETNITARLDAVRAIMPAIDALPDHEPEPCVATLSRKDGEPRYRCRLLRDHAGEHEWQALAAHNVEAAR